MTTPLTIGTDRRDDGTVAVVASGEIDMSNVAEFARALTEAIGAGDQRPVTVDLTAVEYLDSGAINTLFSSAEDIRVIANPLLIPVLTISRLTELVSVEPPPERPDA
ncbi:STAS domain-containing protein [Mycobacterium sp. MYCO198283]|uniref:STAS domain-containing protein n=1 Tax=Mycobacterium sp. MYCO198283 TaxID=2883505 RepID=UPI001E49A45D|nr:STAS domain-containing protein [Mycobacterium sp. MYCO198283]MCG5433295.1 STAS domain-containing protein [Mycobacterium sp. MYCO198283]